MKRWLVTSLALVALSVSTIVLSACGRADPDKVIIGYIVKQPDEPWFRTEWKFAQKCADENHFELLQIAARNGTEVMTALDTLNAKGARGFVICTPDPTLGRSIVDKAHEYGMKFMTVDDQLVDANGKIYGRCPAHGHVPAVSARLGRRA